MIIAWPCLSHMMNVGVGPHLSTHVKRMTVHIVVGQVQNHTVVIWAVHDRTFHHMNSAWPYLSPHEQCMTVHVITWTVHDRTCHHMNSAWPYMSSHEQCMTVPVITWTVHDHTCRHMSSTWPYLSSHEQCMTIPVVTWAVHDRTCHHMSSAWPYGSGRWWVRTPSVRAGCSADRPGRVGGSTCTVG